VIAATELFETSIRYADCTDGSITTHQFVQERACDLRFSHGLFLNEYMAQVFHVFFGDNGKALDYGKRSQALLESILQTPRFSGPCCEHWKQPLDFNFNAVFFPNLPSAPVWSLDARLSQVQLPMVRFLEESYKEIRAELEDLLKLPREYWTLNVPGQVNSEHLASPHGWHMLAIVRHGEWNHLFCKHAQRTCALLGSRPEIQNCTVSNSNIMQLAPGGLVKPHFGNAPRVAVHLPLIVPEPEAASMQIGDQTLYWEEGKVILFDDTYVHSVNHHGVLPRYVLNVWFCHPCDNNTIHNHKQNCTI